MAGANDYEEQPQPFDAKRLEPAKRRRRSPSPTDNGSNSSGRRPSPAASSNRRRRDEDAASYDELPQPYDAKGLQPARKRQRSGSPSEVPRKQKRPGQRARISEAEREHLRQRAAERERQMAAAAAQAAQSATQVAAAVDGRGAINDVVRAHYNAVPERGRDWRKTDSKIKGLRSLNNWVKSCIIQKFSPDEDYTPGATAGEDLLVLDIGCGKGGDLGKWQQAPQSVALYVGLDPADISVEQARERYRNMADRERGGGRGGRGGHHRRPQRRLFDARFHTKDCFGESLADMEIVQQVGFDAGGMGSGRRGFDIVSMMFCMHYAFETEQKARTMLKNVAGALKKGGRLIGCIPNSDVLGEEVRRFNERVAEKKKAAADGQVEEGEDGEVEEGEAEETAEWGNSIYRVRFPGKTPEDGIFRPPFGWKYNFFLDEAVEEVPEYVVPWEAFRALAEDYNLELQYHKKFADIWEAEKDDPTLGPLSERMGVRERGRGPLLVSSEEMDAASFYVAFCFYKV